jgi:glycosyltransferase involved in cell wall biosynthesis
VLLVMSRLLATGGAGRSIAELAIELRDHEIEPIVVCFARDRHGLEDEVERAGVEVVVLDAESLAAGVRRLRAIIRSRRPDVVHTTLYTADQAGRLAAWGTGVPVLSSIVNPTHDPAMLREGGPAWRRRVLWAFDGWTARHLTAHFHAITHAVARSAVRGLRVPPERVTVIHRTRAPARLGEPGAARRATTRRALGVDPDVPLVVTVGRQAPQKAQRLLLDAFASVLHDLPDAQLLVVGAESTETAALRRRADEPDLAGHVALLGHRDDVGDLLAAGDVFALPSIYEGLGAAVIEAMALALPVVASDLDAIREVVEPDATALLVPVGDEPALADALLRLLRDPALASELGTAGRARYLARYTPECMIDAFVGLYRDVAARRDGPPADAPRVLFVCGVNGHGGPIQSICTVLDAAPDLVSIAASQHLRLAGRATQLEVLADDFVPMPRPRGLRGVLAAQWALLRRARRLRHRADVIHANGMTEAVVVLPLALVTRLPVVVWVHNWEVPRPFLRMRRLLRRTTRHWTWLAVSGLARDVVVSTGVVPEDRIEVVPNPIGSSVVAAHRVPSEQLRIGFVAGTDRASKGFDLIGPTAAALGPVDARWVIFTSSPYQTNHEGWRALDALPEALYEVRSRERNVADAFAECDVVFAPSRQESFNRVVAEAMVNGLPVVASDLAVHRELLGDDEAGLLFPVDDPDAAARALRRVVDDPEMRTRLGVAGRSRAARFAPDRVVPSLRAAYRAAAT